MSAPVQTVTTSGSATMNKLWRKVQGRVQEGFRFLVEEWNWMEKQKELKVDWSFREITFPVHLVRSGGVASIAEGAYEARPSSAGLEECTINWIHLNARFNASMQARWVSEQNASAALENQLVFQGKDKLAALAAEYGDQFHGYSNGVVCLTDTDIAATTTATLTLKTPYGDTNVGNNSAIDFKEFLANKFVVGDRIAVLHPSTATLAAANTIGDVTAVSETNGTITVTWIGTAGAVTTDGLRIVKANSIDPANTVATTSLDRAVNGVLDMVFSSSLHGLTHDRWAPAIRDTAGGRFNGVRYQKARDRMGNRGGGKADKALVAQGVDRDLFLQYQAGVRYDSPTGIEMDGSVKLKGVEFLKSQRIMPGTVTLYDSENSMRNGTLLRKPSRGPNWGDGQKLENQSAMVFGIDWPVFHACVNRQNIAFFGNLTEAN